MKRKRIELEKNAILPVARTLWSSAEEKLREAEESVVAMCSAANRVDYEAGWTRFVDSLEEFWARFFDEGKSSFSNFQPWAGHILSKRKDEELLTYLYQARHQSQHGRIAMQWSEPRLIIAPGFNGHLHGFNIYPDGTFEIDATPAHSSLPNAEIVQSPGVPILPQIENKKFGQSFPLPKVFEGKPLQDSSPVEIAKIGLIYYRNVLDDAYAKFKI